MPDVRALCAASHVLLLLSRSVAGAATAIAAAAHPSSEAIPPKHAPALPADDFASGSSEYHSASTAVAFSAGTAIAAAAAGATQAAGIGIVAEVPPPPGSSAHHNASMLRQLLLTLFVLCSGCCVSCPSR